MGPGGGWCNGGGGGAGTRQVMWLRPWLASAVVGKPDGERQHRQLVCKVTITCKGPQARAVLRSGGSANARAVPLEKEQGKHAPWDGS